MGIIILTKGFLLGIKSNENEKKEQKKVRFVSESRDSSFAVNPPQLQRWRIKLRRMEKRPSQATLC